MRIARTSGRQKGTPNKSTQAIRERIAKLINITEDEIVVQNDISNLKPKDRVDFYVKLMSFVCPKPIEQEDDKELNARKNLSLILSSLQKY